MRTTFRLMIPLIFRSFLAPAEPIEYTLDGKGLPLITKEGKSLVSCTPLFWGAKWKWAGAEIKRKPGSAPVFSLSSRRLHLTGDLRWTLSPAGGMSCRMDFRAAETSDPAIGGGLEFRPALGASILAGKDQAPELLGKRGWEWKLGNGERLAVTFEPELPNIYFERGNEGVIRCMFYQGSVPAGERTITMTVTLPSDSRLIPSLDQRYGDPDTSGWFRNPLHPTRSFIDLGELNHRPAGRFGFVRAEGDHFVLGNGEPIRFWGCNVQAYSLFTEDRDRIRAHAERIAALGFNLVRLHHHDSQTWVRKCLIEMGSSSRELDADALDTYFYWIRCLRDEGIYVWVDLHVGRPFRAGDEIPGFDELLAKSRRKEAGAEAKGYCYVNQRIQELMQEFNRKLVTTVNPHTGLALKDDPAVMGFLLTNENDLTHHFGNALLADKKVPHHNRLFQARIAEFAARTGLDAGKLGQTWLPGPAKLLLNDMEYRWNMSMIQHLRSLGVRQPIDTGHMWGGTALFSLPALTAGDMIDVHAYSRGAFLLRNPRGGGCFADFIARSQVLGKPLTITEWNVEDSAPARDMFVMPVMVAAMGSLQGWDAPMLYGYSQDALSGSRISAWSSHNYPNIIGIMPAMALLFREGHVRPARETYVARLTRESCFMRGSGSPETAFRTLSLQHRIAVALPRTAELPWLKSPAIPDRARVFEDLERDFIPPGRTYVESDTGELRRDWRKGILSIDTPKSQGAAGWLQGNPVALRDVTLHITVPKAVVMLTSLDGRPIARSERILLTALARIRKRRSEGRQTALSEPVTGVLQLRSNAAGLTLSPLNGDGAEQPAIRLQKREERFLVPLPADKNTHWFVIKRTE